jgi:ABC-type branched-subunit amino acid transport system permease subunit
MKKTGKYLLWAVLAVVILLLPQIAPNLYVVQIINMVGIYIILATGINILTGYAGQLSSESARIRQLYSTQTLDFSSLRFCQSPP